jgi:GNAT superfamily N-acetyltransferase
VVATTRLNVRVVPATRYRWNDMVDLFGEGGDAKWCWCQWFIREGTRDENKLAMRDELSKAEVPPGVLAYDPDGRCVGWLRMTPVVSLPRAMGPRSFPAIADAVGGRDNAGSVWYASCFVVRVGCRRRGVSLQLLRRGVDFAREHGATAVIGRPLDTALYNGKTNANGLYVGALSTFLRVGFIEVGRTGPKRAVVRLDL